MDMMTQALELNNRPHVVVATPGRLVDHMNSGTGEWTLNRVKFLVGDFLAIYIFSNQMIQKIHVPVDSLGS
jgi:hypothetical protein